MLKYPALCFVAILLTACGGSGGSDTSPTPSTPTTPPATTLTIAGDTTVASGQSVGIVALLDNSSSDYQFKWSQISGQTLELLTTDSQVLSFDVQEPGEYGFEVAVYNNAGTLQFNESRTLTVTSEILEATVRLDHAVSETAKVSLRADAQPETEIISMTWQQVSGQTVPQANFTESEDINVLFFDAPSVSSDQLLQFRATMTLDNGQNINDDVYVLVKNVNANSDGFFPGSSDRIVTTEMRPYNLDSPYAQALENCVYNNTVDASCSFNTLPLLGMISTTPSIDQVMDRVYVSHQWMGDRLKNYLENSVAAGDMLTLFRGVTAIVISYEVRPSFYWVATGAIYLDANNFWVTAQERDTLNDQPDYRSAFGNDLQFFMPWRYVKDGASYLNRANYPRAQRTLQRTFQDVEADITWLLYHELAHANDFFPPDRISSISASNNPLNYFNDTPADSTSFANIYPLTSQQLKELAMVSFAGETATAAQRNVTPQQAADLFQNDDAAMYYSYRSIREDYATLFERFMMAWRFGAEADTAVAAPISENPELIITWGQRSRINDAALLNRTRQVVRNIYPELDVNTIQPTLPESKFMTPGLSWQDNLVLGEARSGKEVSQAKEQVAPLYQEHYLHKGRPVLPQQKD